MCVDGVLYGHAPAAMFALSCDLQHQSHHFPAVHDSSKDSKASNGGALVNLAGGVLVLFLVLLIVCFISHTTAGV